MSPVLISLPWPDRKLSPNGRIHHMVLAKAKKAYRETCYVLTKERKAKVAGEQFDILLHFVPPDRRRYDVDGLLSRMKSGLDGVADALGIDDRCFKRTTCEIVPTEPPAGDRAHVLLVIRDYAPAAVPL